MNTLYATKSGLRLTLAIPQPPDWPSARATFLRFLPTPSYSLPV